MKSYNELKKHLAFIIRTKLKKEKELDSKIHYGGRSFDETEIISGVDALLDMWLTHSKNTDAFEEEFRLFFNSPYCLSSNSGSSANLLMISALRSRNYSRRIPDNSIVATPALTFPTTVSPLYYNQVTPLYLDIEINTLNMDLDSLCRMAREYPVKAIMLPHIMGNTANMDELIDFCLANKIHLIEDCCEAMGTRIQGRYAGTIGISGSFSLYASHHITSGEGGMIITADEELHNIMVSLRDWGRIYPITDGRPLLRKHDIRYTYTEAGFNLKQNEIFSAIGRVQLRKLNRFNEKRKENFDKLLGFINNYPQFFIPPKSYKGSEPSWFGFPLILKENTGFDIQQLKTCLENHLIETKSLFSGNITLQPAFGSRRYLQDKLDNTDYLMDNSIFIGVYPGIGNSEIDHMTSVIRDFLKKYE